MPSSWKSGLLTALRVVLVAAGVSVAAATVLELASMPPPRGDGFAHGMAAIVGGVIIFLSLGVASVAVILPTLLGRDDPLGFDRWQRRALKGAGVLIAGGFVVGLAYGVVTNLPLGFFHWLLFVAMAAVVVGATLVWRLAEVVVGLLSRIVGERAP